MPLHVLEAFDVQAPVRPLAGGRGTSVLAGHLVLKPGADTTEWTWFAGLARRTVPRGIRLPAPIPSVTGVLVVDGWSATPFVHGDPVPDDERGMTTWLTVLRAGRALHRAISAEARPDFLPMRSHRWAVADRMAWGEVPLRCVPRSTRFIDAMRPWLVDESLRSQLVHGDLSGNVLLAAGLEPAVIDFSPYWRPAAYADAVVVVDALLWWRAEARLIDVARPPRLELPRWRSLLARALTFRLLARDETSHGAEELDREMAGYERVHMLLAAMTS